MIIRMSVSPDFVLVGGVCYCISGRGVCYCIIWVKAGLH